MRRMNTRARTATLLGFAGLITLPLAPAPCGYQLSLGDYTGRWSTDTIPTGSL